MWSLSNRSGKTPLDYCERAQSKLKREKGRGTEASLWYHLSSILISLQKIKGVSDRKGVGREATLNDTEVKGKTFLLKIGLKLYTLC